MILRGILAFVLAAIFLVTAAVLAKETRWQRRFAVLSASVAAGVPWLAPADVPWLRGGLAIWTTLSLGRVIDLVSDSRNLSFGARLWHVLV